MKKVFKTIVFLLAVSFIFSVCDKLLVRKSIYGWWNMTTKVNSFFNSPKNKYDVIFFGSSHAYASFNPLIIYEETGLKSHVIATQKQPLWATYFYIDEAIKRQDPSLIVLDTYAATFTDDYSDEATVYTYCDDFPFGINKLKLINESTDNIKRKFDYAIRFTKYHTRWNELNQDDFNFSPNKLHDWLYGYCKLTTRGKDIIRPDTSSIDFKTPLTDKNEMWLKKIITLCKNNGIDIVLVKTPDNETGTERSYYNYIEELAVKNNISFVNYNNLYDEICLDPANDFFDKTHLNQYGADKFSRFISSALLGGTLPKDKSPDEWYERALIRYNREISGNYNPFEYTLFPYK